MVAGNPLRVKEDKFLRVRLDRNAFVHVLDAICEIGRIDRELNGSDVRFVDRWRDGRRHRQWFRRRRILHTLRE
jgi:hypothetical protein